MRRLQKGDKPEVLVANETPWTAAYVAARLCLDGRKHERWNHLEIKRALSSETGGKCAYCEAFVADVSYPHIDHIKPKSTFPELAHIWENLAWSCSRCNQAKSDFFDSESGILNPFADDVEQHLDFWGELIGNRLGQARGEVTLHRLKLNRLDLVHSRRSRITMVLQMLERWHAASEPLRAVLAESIRVDAREGEFSGTIQALLTHKGFESGTV